MDHLFVNNGQFGLEFDLGTLQGLPIVCSDSQSHSRSRSGSSSTCVSMEQFVQGASAKCVVWLSPPWWSDLLPWQNEWLEQLFSPSWQGKFSCPAFPGMVSCLTLGLWSIPWPKRLHVGSICIAPDVAAGQGQWEANHTLATIIIEICWELLRVWIATTGPSQDFDYLFASILNCQNSVLPKIMRHISWYV